jgi:hypothetical protein
MSLEDKFDKVYAELPAWIADATTSKCRVDKRDSIISKLITYVIKPYISRHKDDLTNGEKGQIEANPLIEAAMRGWKDLPIRPLSKGEMERALVGISGSRLIAGESVKLSYLKKNETKFLVIEMERPPPPPPRIPVQVKAIEIWEIGNIVIGMELLRKNRLRDSVETMDISIETEDGCAFHIVKASLEDLEWIIGEDPINAFINRLSPQTSLIKLARLHIKLSTSIDKQKIERMMTSLGISEGNYTLTG